MRWRSCAQQGQGAFSAASHPLGAAEFKDWPLGAARTGLGVQAVCPRPALVGPGAPSRPPHPPGSACCLSLPPPGYEGVSEFFTDLLNHITTVLQGQSAAAAGTGDVAPLRHSRLLAEQAGGLAAERTCSASPGCCSSMMGQEPPWTAEADVGGVGAGSASKLPHQRLGCTAAVSPSFQQHCVASLATKASSQ